ncbi:MAG: MetS family NSS transporter small subunit [Gemmatimonadota bacterium]
MTASAWVTLVVICGFVWGGAFTLVTIAMRKEGRKRRTGSGVPED